MTQHPRTSPPAALACAKAIPGRKLFACDELQTLVGTNSTTQECQAIIETGRIHGRDAAMLSIAPNLIHNRIRRQATEVVAFRCLENNALAWLEELGSNPEAVKALPRGSYRCRTAAGGEAAGSVF